MALSDVINPGNLSSQVQASNNLSPLSQGFGTVPIPSTSRNGLPSSQIINGRFGVAVRKNIHWFVPEVGIIKMFINPESIDYQFNKIITKERTKGGYSLQYWGEELPVLTISGTTGSSGIEGINVLYEIFRAEQYVFDSAGLSIDSITALSNLTNLISDTLGGNIFSSAAQGALGLSPANQNLIPSNIPSLASLAFGVEMYYSGWVFRGYFNDFSFRENVQSLGMFNYTIHFTVTQRRGYRVNDLPWQKSATSGPSDWGTNPLSFGNYPSVPQNAPPVSITAANAREMKVGISRQNNLLFPRNL